MVNWNVMQNNLTTLPDYKTIKFEDLLFQYVQENNAKEVIEYLRSDEINISHHLGHTDALGNTALHVAAILGDLATIEALALFHPELNQRNHQGQTPLHVAALAGYLPVVEFLYHKTMFLEAIDLKSATAAINSEDSNKNTILHLATTAGHLSVVEFLCNQAVDVNIQNESGNTALHLAVIYGRFSILGVLLEFGMADATIKNHQEKTAEQLAQDFKYDTFVNLIHALLDGRNTKTNVSEEGVECSTQPVSPSGCSGSF